MKQRQQKKNYNNREAEGGKEKQKENQMLEPKRQGTKTKPSRAPKQPGN